MNADPACTRRTGPPPESRWQPLWRRCSPAAPARPDTAMTGAVLGRTGLLHRLAAAAAAAAAAAT